MLTLDRVYQAAFTLKEVARNTDLILAEKLSEEGNLYLKTENLQRTGSFKLRGAYFKMTQLSDEEKAKGIVACSAGNHAQGVALAANRMGIHAVVCMPDSAPIMKIESTKALGAEVCLVKGTYDDAHDRAVELQKETGMTFLHPYDDPDVIAGQGTIGLEILEQVPDVDQIIVPIGGGGLISGVAAAVKLMRPNVKVIGVQAATVPSMFVSERNGYITTVKDGATIADGIHVLTPGDLTFEMVGRYVDEIVTVTEDEIAAAIVALLEGPKTVAEGAGATSVAAFLFDKVDTSLKTCAIVSGGNVDITTLSRIITKGLQKYGRIARITTKLVDRSGSLAKLLQLVTASGANILSIEHEREDAKTEVNSCVVSITLETRDVDHIVSIRREMREQGYLLFD